MAANRQGSSGSVLVSSVDNRLGLLGTGISTSKLGPSVLTIFNLYALTLAQGEFAMYSGWCNVISLSSAYNKIYITKSMREFNYYQGIVCYLD